MGKFSMQIWGANGSVLDTEPTHFRLKKYRYKYRFVIVARMVFLADETIVNGMNVLILPRMVFSCCIIQLYYFYIRTILMLQNKNLVAMKNH